MILRKWRTNYPEVKNKIPDELQEKSQSPLPLTDQSPKALGIHWDVSSDSLHVAIPPSPDLTIFDVLGLFAPAVIQARIILQETGKRSLPWDKPFPPDLLEKWKSWTQGKSSTNPYTDFVMPPLWPMVLPCTFAQSTMTDLPQSP